MDGRAREERPHTVKETPRQHLLFDTPFSPPKDRLFAPGFRPAVPSCPESERPLPLSEAKVAHFGRKEETPMPARNPRVNVVLEKPLYEVVGHLAKEEGVSLSTIVRDLVKEAIEIREDIDLGRIAESREKSLKRSRALAHKDIWG